MNQHKGFNLMEIIISLGILALLISVITVLQINIFRGNRIIESRASIDQRSLNILRTFTMNVRAAQTPYDGSFMIANATDSEVSFYSDINGDGIIERIRYYIEQGNLQQGIIIPSGQPLNYSQENEKTTILIKDIVNNPPYFIYYDESFDGINSVTPLAQPLTLTDIHLVELNVGIDTHIQQQGIRTLQTRAMLRSLKN